MLGLKNFKLFFAKLSEVPANPKNLIKKHIIIIFLFLDLLIDIVLFNSSVISFFISNTTGYDTLF